MKADKGNCFVVMVRSDYDEKMQELLDDQQTYEKVTKPPFKKIERDLNSTFTSTETRTETRPKHVQKTAFY
jgi:hypothetical protein